MRGREGGIKLIKFAQIQAAKCISRASKLAVVHPESRSPLSAAVREHTALPRVHITVDVKGV